MLNDKLDKTVRIPIRIVNGNVKYFYGSSLPKMKDYVLGDLKSPARRLKIFIEIKEVDHLLQQLIAL